MNFKFWVIFWAFRKNLNRRKSVPFRPLCIVGHRLKITQIRATLVGFFFLGPKKHWLTQYDWWWCNFTSQGPKNSGVVKKSGHKNFFAWLSPSLLGIQRSILPWIHNWKFGCQTFAHPTNYRQLLLICCVFSGSEFVWRKDFWL